MKTEISKGTQKFVWHLVAFVAVFVLALVIICRVLPEPNRALVADKNTQITTAQTEDNLSTDFDSAKERVDQATSTTGKEVKSLYSGEEKSTMQKQLETRLFFNTLKSILICVLLVVVVIVLIKKGFSKAERRPLSNGSLGISLCDWSLHGLKWYAGAGRYRIRFRIQKKSSHYELDLGHVAFYAEIRVNGQLAGKRIWEPYRVDVTDLLQDGENEILVITANSAAVEHQFMLVDEGQALAWNDDNIQREGENLTFGLLRPVQVWRRE